MEMHQTDLEPTTLADHGYFYVGAKYVEIEGRTVKTGGMYVEKYVPLDKRQPYPVVLIHGGSQTGTNFFGTPDGRRGWMHDFLRAGYAVYLVDQPERGRSGHSQTTIQGGHLIVHDVTRIARRFTALKKYKEWPQAHHHTQWPGSGDKGDPVFDQFYAAQADTLWDRHEIERLNQNAGAALLDEIGPAILLTHSQSGPFGWLIADARPDKVKGILALEPNGPPFRDVLFTGHDDWYEYDHDDLARPNGPTRVPLTFDPPLEEGETLKFELRTLSDDPELVKGYLQQQPARQLPKLKGIPIIILIADASYHSTFDHVTSAFLKQAGVDHDLVHLADKGINGNGHMMMLEKNNHDIADFMIDWLSANCR